MKPRRKTKPGPDSRVRFISTHHVLIAFLIIVAAFSAAHGKRVIANHSTYQWEDTVFIRHNAATIHSFTDCFIQPPVWPGLYRPLSTNLYYFIGRKVFSNAIGIHHLINVVVYVVNGLLLYLICLHFVPRVWAVVAAGLFVSRLSHVEVVLNTCEMQSLLAVFFTLSAIGLFMLGRHRKRTRLEWPALIAFILALFSKETALVVPVVLVVYWWLFDEWRAWRHYLAPILTGVAWVVLFAVVFRGVTGHRPTGFSYNFSPSHLLEGGAAYFLTFFNSLSLKLESIVMVPGIAAAAGTALVGAAFGLLVAVIALFLVLYPRVGGRYSQSARVLIFGFLLFLAGAAPYLILESRLFMRYGYFGHAGLAIAGAVVLRETAAALSRLRRGTT